MAKVLNEEMVEQAQDLTIREVEIPEWDGTAWFYGLNGTDRMRFAGMASGYENRRKELGDEETADDLIKLQCWLIARCMRNDKGQMVTNNPSKLADKSADVLQRLFDVCLEVSGIGESELESAKKNSNATES